VAAVRHARRAAGADTDPRYLRVARERVRLAAAGLLPTRPMTRPVYEPGTSAAARK
jgi:adenine-specific DNA-methyltransferase